MQIDLFYAHIVLFSVQYPYTSNCFTSWAGISSVTTLSQAAISAAAARTNESRQKAPFSNIRYSMLYCQRLCLLIKTRQACNCYNSDLDVNPGGLLDAVVAAQNSNGSVSGVGPVPGIRLCSQLDRAQVECKSWVLAETTTCNMCQRACRDSIYEKVISTARWPAKRYLKYRWNAKNETNDKDLELQAIILINY